MSGLRLSRAVALVIALFAAPSFASAQFTYEPAGSLAPGSGRGRVDARIYAAGMRFPIRDAPAYANSQVYGVGGSMGPAGGQCDARNYSYPWRDNYCESRSWSMPLCPSSRGHQGQDIRPGTCRAGVNPAVATADGTITSVGRFSVYLTDATGTRYDYLHLSNVAVRQGQRVRCGDVIGNVSNVFNGTPTTIHLHFNIRQAVRGVGSVYVPTYATLVDSYQRLLSGDTMCGGAPIDAGMPDAGRLDAGTTPRDSGVVTPRDSGVATPRDSGVSTPRDSGVITPGDAGVSTPRDAGPPPGCRSTVIGRVVPVGECVQVGPERRECGAGCGWYRCATGGAWACAEPSECGAQHENPACETEGAGCHSAILGRTVEHGACVQSATAACGVSRCGWYRCADTAFSCVDVAACSDDVFPAATCSAGSGCGQSGAICQGDSTCCSGFQCVAGVCRDPAACGIESVSCGNASQCCRGLSCLPESFGGSRSCCVGWEGGYCQSDDDCCGEITCSANRCVKRTAGQSCASSWDCIYPATCNGGSCS